MKLKKSILLIPFLLLFTVIYSQTTFDVTFDDETVGQVPSIAPGNGTKPTLLSGDYQNTMRVQPISGVVGSNATASGNVVEIEVLNDGENNRMHFDALLNSGIITEGIVKVSFDFIAYNGGSSGYGFLRNIDENSESMADIAFNFTGISFNVGILSYDPVSGEYLDWLSPAFPNNSFDAGEWYRFESTVDLDNNTYTLTVNGVDFGVTGSISRATGSGFSGSIYNWGTAFKGKAGIDNFKVEIINTNSLPTAPSGFMSLLEPDAQGCTVFRLPNGDFREAGIDWQNNASARLTLKPYYQGVNSYNIKITEDFDDEGVAFLRSKNSFAFKPNRTYEVSALIRTNFPRDNWEFNIEFIGSQTLTPSQEDFSQGTRYGGLPAVTCGPDGWERWTWQFTPHWDRNYDYVNVSFGIYEFGPGFNTDFNLDIADLAFIELPKTKLDILAPGEGVTFPGGSGNLEMVVEDVQINSDIIKVTVTGAIAKFNITEGTLKLNQRIDYERLLVELEDLPLNNLTVQSQTNNEVVLVGTDITIGVQMDGVVVMRPHTTMNPTIKNKIDGGDFNRLTGGDLLSQDDFGGFTVNNYSPKGSGIVPTITPITPDLPFIDFLSNDLSSTGAYEGEWSAKTTAQPGEILFVSAFPNRPYDWEKSFKHNWSISNYDESLDYNDPPIIDNWVLWNFNERAWAMSFGKRYELRNNIPSQDHFNAANMAGDNWSAYFSQWFYYSRDAEEWATEVLRWRDEYNMTAAYSDGLAQDDLLSAYEAMRRLRGDVFQDGDIIIHDSFPQSGLPAAAFRPFIHSYATSTYMGESAQVDAGADWAWARYVMGQYRRSNAIGITKGDGWTGFEGVEKYLVALVWNGRGRRDVFGFDSEYLSILNQLKQLWETYGSDPYFFDRYYHPDAQTLTGYNIGRAGMPIFEIDDTDPSNLMLNITSRTPNAEIFYTTDDTEPTMSSLAYTDPIPYDGNMKLRVKAFRSDLDESREAFLEDFSFSADDFLSSSTIKPYPNPVKLYPNPGSDKVSVHLDALNLDDLEVLITDLTGKKVQESIQKVQSNSKNILNLDISKLTSGLYIVSGKKNNQYIFREKLVVK